MINVFIDIFILNQTNSLWNIITIFAYSPIRLTFSVVFCVSLFFTPILLKSQTYINVKVYDNTGSTAPLYDLATDLDLVNTMYAPHGIQFNFCVEEVQNQNWLVNPAFGFLRATCPNQHNYIDLLVNTDAGVGGGEALSRVSGEVATRVWALNGVYQIAHELGHAMGLHHTFYDSVNFGDDGDLIDDTPFHVCDNDALFSSSVQFSFAANPLNWEVDGNGNSVCEIVWENIRDNDGNGTPYPANHDSDNVLYNNVMSELHTDVSPACPATGRTWVFTDGQGQRMLSNINTYLTDYIGSANTCPGTPVSISGSLSSNESYFNKAVIIDGNVTIDSDVKFDNCNFTIISGSSIVVNNGAELEIFNSALGRCDSGNWEGLEVTEGGYLNISKSYIFNANVGIGFKSNTTKNGNLSVISDVEFVGNAIALNITGVGDNTDNPTIALELIDLTVRNSAINFINSAVIITGGLYADQITTCTNSSLFTRVGKTRPEFSIFGSLIYKSGNRLQIDETVFRSSGVALEVESCEYLTICRSSFDAQDQAPAVRVNNTAKMDVFYNQFSGPSSSDILILESGSYGDSPFPNQQLGSYIRDNIFYSGKTHINLDTDSDDLNIRCNIHESYSTAWDINGLIKDQGSSGFGADNVFEAGTDIDNSSTKFIYYYNEDNISQNSTLRPDQVTNVDVIQALGSPGELCETDVLGDVINGWEEYFTCITDPDPHRICCEYTVTPPPTEPYECIICPPPIGDPDPDGDNNGDGGRTLGNNNSALFSNQIRHSKDKDINIRSREYIEVVFSPNPVRNYLNIEYDDSIDGATLFIYNSVGILVKTNVMQSEVNVTELFSGLYYTVIKDNFNQIIKVDKFVKE